MATTFGSRWMAAALVLVLGAGIPGSARPAEAQGSPAPLADDPTLIALAVALACADAPETVNAPPAEPATVTATGPALELVATVRAKALKFDEVPKVNVTFHGTGKRHTVWKTERVNLPAHPQPGVTYKDVQVKLTVTSDIDELGSLLSQAKRASRGIRIEPDDAPAAASPAAPSGSPAAAPAPRKK